MTITEVPAIHLLSWGGWWMPYAARIAKREGCELSHYVGEALSGEARIFVIWGEDGKPTGAIATRIIVHYGATRLGEIHWMAGDGMSRWLPVCIPQIEAILIRDHGVTRFIATGRPGLERVCKPLGYRRKRVILEKGAGDL